MSALVGGAMIGASAALYLALFGRVAGVSGMLRSHTGSARHFLLGLLAGGVLLRWLMPAALSYHTGRSLPAVAVGGVLVGLGTHLGNGCTSGHGVCGLGRRSERSLAATLTFMALAFLTVWLTAHHWPGTLS
jgi:uncharacterized protein